MSQEACGWRKNGIFVTGSGMRCQRTRQHAQPSSAAKAKRSQPHDKDDCHGGAYRVVQTPTGCLQDYDACGWRKNCSPSVTETDNLRELTGVMTNRPITDYITSMIIGKLYNPVSPFTLANHSTQLVADGHEIHVQRG